jgi:transposase
MVDLTDAEWAAVAPHIPAPPFKKKHTGRPRKLHRDVLNGILYISFAHRADLADSPRGFGVDSRSE